MSIVVPNGLQNWAASEAQIRVVAKSTTLALPLVEGVNHILGHHMLGLIHCQTSSVAREGVGRVITYAHPNCVTLVAEIEVENSAEGVGSEVTFQAGTGTAITIACPADGRYGPVGFSWGAGDTEEEITYDPTDCEIRSCTIWGLYRTMLDVAGAGADLGCEAQDFTSLAAGMRENNAIINGDGHSDLEGLAVAIANAKQYTIRQAVAWSNLGDTTRNCVPGAGTGYPMPAGFTWQHRSQEYRAADASQDYVVWVRSYFNGNPALSHYHWTLTSTSTADTATSNPLTRIAAEWDKGATGLLIGCDADDYIELSCTCTDAAATVTVVDVSIFKNPI
jgi:hypothetical protein